MENVKELYGIEPMSFDEEMALWREHEYKAQTRNNKVRLGVAFQKMMKDAEHLAEYSKRIPEEDNAEHAQKVAELTEVMERIEKEIGNEFYRIVYGIE